MECGKIAFDTAVAASEKGDWATAARHFREALALRPHPVIAFNLALAEARIGQFVEAVARLDEVLQNSASPKNILGKAKAERDAAARSIAVVVIDSATAQNATVTLDGVEISGSPPRAQVNPGEHALRVTVAGRAPIERTVALLAGETLRVTIDRSRELVVVPDPVPRPASSDAGAVDAEAPAAERAKLSPTWFYAGLGLTAMAGALTIWSGLDTTSSLRSYERDLPNLTQDQINRRISDGHSKELRTNLLLATTGVLAAGTATVGLFFVRWGPSKSAGASVHPTAQGLMVLGRF